MSTNRVRFGSFEKRAYLETVRLDSRRWQVIGSYRGQAPIGGFGMLTSSGNAVVATPGSGGVVLLRTSDLTALTTFRTGGEPLEAALLPDGYVAARNWKTGDLLIGTVMSRPTRVSRDA